MFWTVASVGTEIVYVYQNGFGKVLFRLENFLFLLFLIYFTRLSVYLFCKNFYHSLLRCDRICYYILDFLAIPRRLVNRTILYFFLLVFFSNLIQDSISFVNYLIVNFSLIFYRIRFISLVTWRSRIQFPQLVKFLFGFFYLLFQLILFLDRCALFVESFCLWACFRSFCRF